MWLEVINEVSGKGTGLKLVLGTSSLNREFKSRKFCAFVDALLLR